MVVTNGNNRWWKTGDAMVVKKRSGATAERFVEVTLEMIEEQGGSLNVNLREVARRVGCAHTNVYNYFDGFAGLLWEAMRRAVLIYGQILVAGLHDDMAPLDYFRQVVTNLSRFPQEHPGLHRFISSDPVDDDNYPQDIIDTVTVLKQWFVDVIRTCAPGTTPQDCTVACNIILGYIDGESANLINHRVLPGEDIAGRMVDYSLRLFVLLTGYDESSPPVPPTYPRLELNGDAKGRT